MSTDRRTVGHKRLLSLVIKIKVVQNVNSMSERYSPTERKTDRKTERLILVIKTKVVRNQKLFRMSTACQKDRWIDRQTDRKTDDVNFKEVIL